MLYTRTMIGAAGFQVYGPISVTPERHSVMQLPVVDPPRQPPESRSLRERLDPFVLEWTIKDEAPSVRSSQEPDRARPSPLAEQSRAIGAPPACVYLG